MKLLTKEIIARLEKSPLYSQEKNKDPEIIVKFFTPRSCWSWCVTEGNKEENGDWTFFGMVHGFEKELGYFTLSELQSVMIERDMYFDGKHLSDV